jgi:hypothetical protein
VLRNVEDLLAERGIDISHETIRFWWNRVDPTLAGEIRKKRIAHMHGYPQWRWHLDEAFVKINGKQEGEGYRLAATQMSILDKELEALEPVPFEFEFVSEEAAGKHKMQCGDWETSAAFWNLSRGYGEQSAVDHLLQTYNEDYPSKGMVFALGTLRKRPSNRFCWA